MNRNKTKSSKQYCDICKNYHDFAFPDDLFESVVNHEVVVFAGAGISTEGRNIFPSTLYQDVLEEIEHSNDNLPSFSQAMSEFCKNKGGRRELIERITERINYARSFPKLYNMTVDVPPKKESNYDVSLEGQKGGINDQKRLHSGADHQ